ncbi:MAG: plasmid pRiA4b ORF-3 family protein [Desulfobacterales bacterium]|nr:plasmid pRiA4b ORF-3 family protein [Desulfobacterales bacterium]
MKLYRMKVSIFGIPRLYRTIEASENCTFDDLHEAIFEAFDRYDPHLYSFFITRRDTKNIRSIMDATEITHPQNVEDMFDPSVKRKSTAKTKIGGVGLEEKDVFHYWFDFGDDWWHRIRVEKITETPSKSKKKHIELVKSLGEAPPQYGDYDDGYDDEFDDEFE